MQITGILLETAVPLKMDFEYSTMYINLFNKENKIYN